MDITFKNVSYIYQKNSPFEQRALEDINVQLPSGSFVSVVGHTGSGKSTFIQHLNGLLEPTEGVVQVGPYELSPEKNKHLKGLRKNVGMVFQNPDHQLFEETVQKEMMFGPKNFGINVTGTELENVIKDVGLDLDILSRSPFDLSGGQKKRVAIASVLVLKPKVLILDEPTAGLDPLGKYKMMELFSHLHKSQQLTIILVTHHMEDALKYSDQMMVMNKGKVVLIDHPLNVFKRKEYLKEIGLALPEKIELIEILQKELNLTIDDAGQSVDELAKSIGDWVKEGSGS
ncbi:energy-coupling factor transporter ATPase [Filobacillus milosensis]|uniref:Energy-coupling factor transporter ATP-binding protein EcfA2 n=1 Tax=Filobacillus milosensis TaxID=94137 RepID=A0A4Y8IEI1_9BACI|nr:energy-coupling factor transporter ATPase [Filobacillus milosensis]TFB14698.1 energy-coupling factor transporter ATPase [Filobacillus milosensis]